MKEKEELDTEYLTVWERLDKLEADVRYLKEVTAVLNRKGGEWPPNEGGR